MYTKLEDLNMYCLSMELGEDVWNMVLLWKYFEKDVLGKQLTRSADSIALNIAEGYGRYSFKERRQFCLIARGSLFETKAALAKAKNRNLINVDQFNSVIDKLSRVHMMLNMFMKKSQTRNTVTP